MPTRIVLVVVFLLIIAGCSGKSTEELFAEGGKELQSGNPNGAVVLFRNALEKNQNHLEARYQLALAYKAAGKYEQAEKEFQKVRRQNPSHPRIRLELAKLYNLMHQWDAALSVVSDYMKANPGSAEALQAAGMAYAGKKDWEDAERHLLRASEADPGNTTIKIDLATTYLAADKEGEALRLLEAVCVSEPSNSRAWHLVAGVEASRGKKDKALAIYQKLEKLNEKDAVASYRAGLIYLDKGDIGTANATADQLLKKLPEKSEGYRLKGMISYHRKNFQDAINYLQSALKIQPNLADNYYLGLSLFNRGELENALSQFRKILDRSPEFAQGRLLTGMILLKQKRVDDAITDLKKVIELDEGNALAHNVLGSAYMAKGMYQEGMEELNLATRLDPRIVEAHLKKGIFNLSRGKTAEFEENLKTAVQVAPELLNSRLILASYYSNRKQYQKAHKMLTEGLTGKASDGAIHTALAKVFFAEGKAPQAIEELQKAKASNPQAVDPYFALSSYYAYAGEPEKASAELSAVVQRDPVNVRALLLLASLSARKGNDNEALEQFTRAANTGNPSAFQALSQFHVKNKDHKKAVSVLEDGLKKNPGSVALLEAKGHLLLTQKEYKEALKTFDDLEAASPDAGITGKVKLHMATRNYPEAVRVASRSVTLRPRSATGHVLLAEIYQEQKDFDKAGEELRKGIAKEPVHLRASLMLAQLAGKKGDYKRALKITSDLLGQKPDLVAAYFAQGTYLQAMGKPKDAAAKYIKALTIKQDYVPALNNLAILYCDGFGDRKEALRLAERALSLEPESGEIMDTMGYALIRNGRFAEARRILEKAAGMLPDNPTVNYHLAVACNGSGDKGQAVAFLQKALQSGAFTEAREARLLLTQLN